MKKLYALLICILVFSVLTIRAQNVFDINDRDSIFSGQPPAPPFGRIAKWGHAVRLTTWGGTGTTTFKSYYFNGMAFRIKFPKTYQQGVSDGKTYPVRIFLHGAGESGNIWDNEYQMYWGGQHFRDAVDNGSFDGFLFFEQSTNGYHTQYFPMITQIMDSLTKYCKLDEARIVLDGLSSGAQSAWDFLGAYPKYIAAALPISAARPDYYPTIPKYVHIPIWLFHGGLDNNPAPAEAVALIDTIRKSGGNILETFYPTLGHGVWNNAWVDPGYVPFMLAAYQSNPLCFFLKTNFCPGQPISAKLGITAGFFAYQWMKDGVLMSNTTNDIIVNQLGTYSARFQRTASSPWSDWSHIPITLTTNSVGTTPPIVINGMKSDWIPAPDSSTTVPLMEPTGYTSYKWVRVSDSAIVGTQNIYNAAPGTYVVQATPFNACSSSYSPAFSVINANGPNAPDPATNLTANIVSQTSIILSWSQNPHPTNSETGFEIYRSTVSGGSYKLVFTNPKDSVNYVDQGLAANTTYYYIVRAINNTAASAVTNQAFAKTSADNTPPTAPSNLMVVGTSPTSVSLQWNAATDNVGVAFYDIYVNGVKAYSTPAGNLSFVINNLTHDQTYNFFVKARDLAVNVSPASNMVTASAVYSGLTYKYYTGSWSALPNFNNLTPVATGTINNVNLTPALQGTNFGLIWTGYIYIKTAGTYTFETFSDDGSALYLGPNGGTGNAYNPSGTPLVNNDGLHGGQSRTGTIALTPGNYPIAITFFQAGGGESMQMLWTCTSAGISRSVIPDSVLVEKITLAGGPPAAPTSLSAVAAAFNRVNLSWTYNTNNGNNPTGFQIFRSSNGSTFTPIGFVSPSIFAFQDTVVSPSTTYSYSIQADGQYGQSKFYPGPGATYSYYNTGSLSSLPNFNTLTPNSTGVVPNFVLGMQTQTTNFAVKYDAYINIILAGTYTFSTSSDDGSALYIGGYSPGNLVVNNDGLHGTTTVSGTKNLNVGIYPITVVFFQAGGGFSLSVNYSGPGVGNQVIPVSVLTSSLISATTPALPAPPQAPTGLKATTLSSSSVGLVWNDVANDATSFQINRSTGDKLNYRVIATVPSNSGTSFSYTDSSLFDNVLYFYKVNGVGPGGSGTASNYDSATTFLNNPVITPIPNFTMRFGTRDTVSVKVTDKDAVPISITAINLPAFGALTDNGNGTATLIFSPAASDSGIYNGIILQALASNGGVARDTFNLIVNSNYPPVLSSIPNASFNEGTRDTIPLTATDQDGVADLVFSSSNLPSFGTIVNNNNGTASIILNPTYISHGVYNNISVTVTDAQGGASTQTFNLTIIQKNPNQQILVRMQNLYAVGSPWNNMTSSQKNNLLATDGAQTTVSFSLSPSSWWNTFNQGPSTGNNSGVYKDSVLREYFYFGIFGGPNTVTGTISGLKPSKKYKLRFYGGSSWTGVPDNGTTIYTVGSQSDSLNVQNNTSRTADFNPIVADSTGSIVVTMNKMGSTPVGYLNAFEVDYIYDDSTAPAKPTNLTATLAAGKGVQLNWTDIAYNAQAYNVYRTLDTTQAFTLLNPGANNSNAVSYLDSTVNGHTTYYYKLKAINNYGDLGFTNTVSITTAAKNPTVTGIANITVRTGATGNLAFSAIDDPGDLVTVTDTLPVFATLQNLGSGNYNIVISPTAGNIGSYNASVTATDAFGAVTTVPFQIIVVESNIKSAYVHFGTDSSSVPAPWNNFLGYPFAGKAMPNLLWADGNNSGITMTLLDQWSNPPVDFGMVTGDNTGLFPDVVNRSSLFEGSISPRRIQISGLDPSKTYNVVLFNSANTGQTSGATVVLGGQSVHLNAAYNTNKTFQFNGLSAPTGTLTMTYTKDANAPFGYFNAIIIQSYDPTVVPIVSPNFVYAEPIYTSRSSLKVFWADRSNNETGFEVWRSTSLNGTYSLVQTVSANTTSYTDQGLTPNTQYFYQIRAVNGVGQSDFSITGSAITPSAIVLEHLTWHFPELVGPWNNTATNPQVGDRYANLKDDQRNNTGIALNVLASFGGEFNGGMVSGNNSYVFPDSVMQSMFWVQKGSQIAVLTLDGLDQSKKYRIGFEGSATWNQDMTGYMTINGVTKYQNADSNRTSIVYFNGVTPDINGQVQMTFGAKGQYGLLGALVIMGYTDNGNSGVPVNIPHPDSVGTATNGQLTAESALTDGLTHFRAYPNPFREGFSVSFDNLTSGKKIDIEVYSMEGKLVYVQEGGYTFAGVNTHNVYLPSTTTPGIYLARIKIDGKSAKLFKLIKTR